MSDLNAGFNAAFKETFKETLHTAAMRLWQPQQYATVFGKCDDRFTSIKDDFARIQPSAGNAGSALCVFYQGHPVVDIHTGSMDRHGCELIPWQSHTMALSYSCGKGILATLVQVLVSEGVLSYDEPIASYWAAFAQNGKENITLRHVLSHQSGLFSIRAITETATDMLDWQGMLKRVETMQPAFAPNEKVAYQAITFGWLVGGCIEKATGQPLAKVLREKLLEPLGIENDVFFGVPDAQLHRTARIIQTNAHSHTHSQSHQAKDSQNKSEQTHKKSSSPLHTVHKRVNKTLHKTVNEAITKNLAQGMKLGIKKLNDVRGIDSSYYTKSIAPKNMAQLDVSSDTVLQACMPAFNGVFTAKAVATIYAMLANGGQWQGKQLIRKPVFAAATRLQNHEADQVFLMSMKWRLGYHKGLFLGKLASSAFGHSGYNASMAWCDPSKQLAVAYIHNMKNVVLGSDFRMHYLNQRVLSVVERLER